MVQNSGRSLIAVEYLQRVSAAGVFLIGEKIAAKLLAVSLPVLNYYGVAITLTAIFVIIVRQLGRSPLIHDLEEICFYDVLVAVYGLIMYLLKYPADSFWGLLATIWLLKFIRIMWWGKNAEGELLAVWPTFGLLGVFAKDRFREELSTRQRWAVYAALGFALVFPVVSKWLFGRIDDTIWLVPIFIGVLMFTKHAIVAIEAAHAKNIALAEENAIIRIQAEQGDIARERNTTLKHATHDVKIPINTMQVVANLANRCATMEAARPHLQKLEVGLRELAGLLDDVVDMADISSRIGPPPVEVIPVNELIEQCQEEFEGVAALRQIDLVMPMDYFLVKGNRPLLQRIIGNLVNNAIVHGQPGNTVTLLIRQAPAGCVVRIRDDGPGIPDVDGPDRAANFHNLVEQQVPRRQNGNPGGIGVLSGHGLGLLGVHRLCKLLGITMTLISTPKRGTVFRFVLPLAE